MTYGNSVPLKFLVVPFTVIRCSAKAFLPPEWGGGPQSRTTPWPSRTLTGLRLCVLKFSKSVSERQKEQAKMIKQYSTEFMKQWQQPLQPLSNQILTQQLIYHWQCGTPCSDLTLYKLIQPQTQLMSFCLILPFNSESLVILRTTISAFGTQIVLQYYINVS